MSALELTKDNFDRSRPGEKGPACRSRTSTAASPNSGEEHALRDGRTDSAGRRSRLTTVEQTLDHCWDLLRQRAARREFGEDPDQAAVRDARTVEGYQQ
ncbi:DUF2630 family protein [Streptomyces sp. NPDC046862]|uniref:DUF2630 family protein n=1 Tax=Streptomyces sp. NPDC046862 TaxID=3154603 RepID=UPI003451BB46